MENGLRRKLCFEESKLFKKVLSGNFPECEVNKLSIYQLEAFVFNLVRYTSAEAGAKTVSMVNYKKPRWWPRNVMFKKSFSNKDQRKQFRLTLRQLVRRCSEFFGNSAFQPKWPPNGRTSWVNDENFAGVKTRGVKRKNPDTTIVTTLEKRKTLIPKNDLKTHQLIFSPCEPVICLQDIFKPPKEPPNQQEFLSTFELCHNNNHISSTPEVPQFSKYIKLHNCTHIPLSSDVGQAIMKRENYSLPEDVTARRLERLEWYINKQPPKKVEQNYEVSFVNKAVDYHQYKFPKRQHHQMQCNIQYMEFLLKLCRPLSVRLERDDLELKKKWYDGLKIKVNVSKLSAEQLNKHLCRDLKIVLNKHAHNTRSSKALISRLSFKLN